MILLIFTYLFVKFDKIVSMKMNANRRLSIMSRHLIGDPTISTTTENVPVFTDEIKLNNVSGKVLHASASSSESSYSRIHGQVPQHPVEWIRVPRVAGLDLTETKYEKSKGEGIAKVGTIYLLAL